MPPSFYIIAALLLALLGPMGAQPREEMTVDDLEDRMRAIDKELSRLSSFEIRTGVGTRGYQSKSHNEAARTEWIQVELDEAQHLDEIIIIPAISRDPGNDYRSDAFPAEFQVIAAHEDGTERVVASFDESNELLPRIAPLCIPCDLDNVVQIRIHATKLNLLTVSDRYALKINQIFLFDGSRNIALAGQVTTSSPLTSQSQSRAPEYLVNGSTPYLMNTAGEQQSLPFLTHYHNGELPVFEVDLGQNSPLDTIQLHTHEVGTSVPSPRQTDFSAPRELELELATEPDYSDAKVLVTIQTPDAYSVFPIICRNFPPTTGRYLRIRVTQPYHEVIDSVEKWRTGFSEIELLSKGANVALGKPFTTNAPYPSKARSLASLSDGKNLFGSIIPIREWLREMARRHDLEVEYPKVLAARDELYRHQKIANQRLAWLVGLLAVGIIFSILLGRSARIRQMAQMRERLAADLHDELGANLHTIGLLSDLASDEENSPDELRALHKKIRAETERSGKAVRHCTEILTAEPTIEGFEESLRRTARRILMKFEKEFSVTQNPDLKFLKPRLKADLLLFYQECLVNISKHSGGTKVTTEFNLTPNKLTLVVHDDGKGFSNGESSGFVPKSIKRRARFLQGKVETESSLETGTRIELQIKRTFLPLPKVHE